MSFMLEEILDQPHSLRETLEAERDHAAEFRKFARRKGFRLIVLVARGTSDNAALFGRYLLELTTGIPVSLAAPSIHTLYKARLDLRDALVVGVSQSGEGTDINLVLKAARRSGAFTLGITNESRSAMASLVDELFLTRGGPQRAVPATKTYTSQLLMFYLLAAALGRGIALSAVSEIPGRVEEALRLASQIRAHARHYRNLRHCAVVARGLNYANAYELSLKLMETCYVVAERFSSADFAHGPVALVERHFPVIVFMPQGRVFEDLRKLVLRLHKLRADTLLISSAGANLPPASRVITLPGSIPEIYTPIPYIVPGQLFAAALAEVKGLNPDEPRSLNIVTRTV